jgi:hypothetical protein
MFEAKMLGRFLIIILGLLFAIWIAVIINFHNFDIHIDHEMDHIESLRKNSLDSGIILNKKQADDINASPSNDDRQTATRD